MKRTSNARSPGVVEVADVVLSGKPTERIRNRRGILSLVRRGGRIPENRVRPGTPRT
jgi:hypothetical protein